MKRIELQDLIDVPKENEENPILTLTREELNQTIKKEKKMTSSFYDIVPTTDLERGIDSVLKNRKVDYLQKARENQMLAEFDRKMKRIKDIKSKTYRRIRRREKVKSVVVENSDSDSEKNDVEIEPDLMLKKLEKDEIDPIIQKYGKNIPKDLLKRRKIEDESNGNKDVVLDNKNILTFEGKKEQMNLVANLFNKTEHFEEFNKEKEAIVEKELPSVEKEILPGWGSWGGSGVDVVETKHNTIIRVKKGTEENVRKDAEHSHVIINENAPTINEKYKIPLPYGYTKNQYQTKMKLPISKELNTLRIFNKFVKEINNKNEDHEINDDD